MVFINEKICINPEDHDCVERMLNQLIRLFDRTGNIEYRGVRIRPILYHGTNDRYLRENTKEGLYSRPTEGDPCIYATADLGVAVERSQQAKYYHSTPKLLVINTKKSLEGLWDKSPSSELTLFKYLRAEHFLALDLDDPTLERAYSPSDEFIELNRIKIEDTIQKILRLRRRVPLENIYPYK